MPLRIIPDRGQVSENAVQPSTKQRCDVLHDYVAGSKFANKSGVFSPKAAACAVDAGPFAGRADVLAGESSADDVNPNSICSQAFGGKGSNVLVAGDAWPMLFEDGAAERLDFTERDGSHSGSFEPEAESADAAEKVEDIHGFRHLWLMIASTERQLGRSSRAYCLMA